jgi:hypothetical protein
MQRRIAPWTHWNPLKPLAALDDQFSLYANQFMKRFLVLDCQGKGKIDSVG